MSGPPLDGTGRHPGATPALLLRRAVLVLLAFGLAGLLAGVVWEWWWTPPTGVVVEQQYLLDADGLRSTFSGTALYVLVAVVAGVLLGVAVAVLSEAAEVWTLVLVVVGSALAGWVMHAVGTALDPPDPDRLAATAEDGTRLPEELSVSGWSPYVAFPSGALLGLTVVFVGWPGGRPASPERRPRGEAGAPPG